MSASNWAVCPRCMEKARAEKAELRAQVEAGYGVLPIDEFDALRARLAEPIDDEVLSTFREDYEIYGANTGTVKVSYSGSCEVCGANLDFQMERSFWSAPEERL